jgi:cytoskeletal protein RodZ
MSARIGTTLREARIGLGLELSDVQEVTKIGVRFLRALEAEDWDAIPGPAYVRGFLRTYAEFLNLDPDPLLAGLEVAEGADVRDLREPIIATGELPAARRVRPGPAIGAALVALVVLLIALGGDDDDEPRGARESAPATTTTETTTPAPTAQPETDPGEISLEVRATGEVWVCLVDRRGRELIEAETLGPGDERGPFESKRFLLTTGNGQLRLTANEEPIDVPRSANPLGFEIEPDGTTDLAEANRPDCA